MLWTSCSTTGVLNVQSVAYQSVTTTRPEIQKNPAIPESARILATYAIDQNGKLAVFVKNLTDEILVVDQEMSFFINSNGVSTSYYDPTVRTVSNTSFGSSTSGIGVNLGAIASAFGVGGPLGTLMGGINVGNSSTSGNSTTNTTVFADQKRISVGPRGSGAMSKLFEVSGIGCQALKNMGTDANTNSPRLDFKKSPIRFKVCISYSLDEGENFEKLITDFYVDSSVAAPVLSKGNVNEAMRKVMTLKPDLLGEPWYLLYINDNIADVVGDGFYVPSFSSRNIRYDAIVQGLLYDYQ